MPRPSDPKVCEWRRCEQPVDRGSAACYFHEKIRRGLIRFEWFETATSARIGRPRGAYSQALRARESS